ncbi:hypothetical protein CUMW_186620 [Citrus unshiu]|nr:hypothetical protein CUMW_186620 [Citrus unshiu]GAY58385.1 hypothetical protein CUMW_186620 [Citrus unshiu]GAY58386.1 hypothetical protein CUMW_186620 [Citrus unshiu]
MPSSLIEIVQYKTVKRWSTLPLLFNRNKKTPRLMVEPANEKSQHKRPSELLVYCTSAMSVNVKYDKLIFCILHSILRIPWCCEALWPFWKAMC